jgi:hypothetical protein
MRIGTVGRPPQAISASRHGHARFHFAVSGSLRLFRVSKNPRFCQYKRHDRCNHDSRKHPHLDAETRRHHQFHDDEGYCVVQQHNAQISRQSGQNSAIYGTRAKGEVMVYQEMICDRGTVSDGLVPPTTRKRTGCCNRASVRSLRYDFKFTVKRHPLPYLHLRRCNSR